MKTLSYYQNLREEYACIIPKTAPAYELIEALDVLIASLQPTQDDINYSIFDYHGQQFRIPKGWRMVREGNGDYTLIDASNVAYGKVRRARDGHLHAWAYVDRDPGNPGYTLSLRGALLGLIDRAWGSADASS